LGEDRQSARREVGDRLSDRRAGMTVGYQGRDQIYVVDDDPVVREVLSIILRKEGYDVICFADGAALLAAGNKKMPACILLDIDIPGPSGIDVLKKLRDSKCAVPVFIISGKGDIPTAVEAINCGAVDFIEKPFRGSDVVARLRAELAGGGRRQAVASDLCPTLECLTVRENEVLKLCVQGASSKEISAMLNISFRTVEDHRSNIIRKLGVRNTAEMVLKAMSMAPAKMSAAS
jgi:FixJ family two-component response regulator